MIRRLLLSCLVLGILASELSCHKKGSTQSAMNNPVPVTNPSSSPNLNPMVLIQTTMGDIKVELNPKAAPISVSNFLTYVRDGYYNGTIFHRVIPGFMIQGGGFDSNLRERPTTHPPIQNEAANGLLNDEGSIAMARTSEVNSATSQFFINVANNVFLNHRDASPQGFGYAVFGKVIQGMNVVHQIEVVSTRTLGPYQNVPVQSVVILSIQEVK